MIIIRQDTNLDEPKLKSLLDKYGSVDYDFNIHLIKDDIDKLNKMYDEAVTKTKKQNIKMVIKYLEGLTSKAQKGKFKVNFTFSKNKIVSFPVEILRIKSMNIQAVDYINIGSKKIIALDYSELINIIAFEIIHRDLDINDEYIEEQLKDIGIISIYDSSSITKMIDENTYEHAMKMRVGSSQYMSADKTKMYTYFGEEVKDTREYRKVVEESTSRAISIIVQGLLSKVNSLGTDVKICGIFSDSIYLMIQGDINKTAEEELGTSIIVRALGRKFEVKPKVQIY